MDLGLENQVVWVTGIHNPMGIDIVMALEFGEEGAKVAMTYKRIFSVFDGTKTAQNGVNRYHQLHSGDTQEVENKIQGMDKGLPDSGGRHGVFGSR
ncbi:MAG: hypothetical protein LBD40_01605 [Puniceicoccales bacterium]|jgi:enoyl-[acyl-carrier-protein] reductase (NADH)|nr:hypothetical protein [Puniceicoccales bacterium]